MHPIDTTYLKTCNEALKKAYTLLKQSDEDSLEYEIYRSAVIKEFEIILDYDGIDEKVIVEVVFKKKLDKRKLKDIKLIKAIILQHCLFFMGGVKIQNST